MNIIASLFPKSVDIKINISGDLQANSLDEVYNHLRFSNREVNLYIWSNGGALAGVYRIAKLLKKKNRKANFNVYIEGVACSAAAMLALLADNIYMSSCAKFMVHAPTLIKRGDVTASYKDIGINKQYDETFYEMKKTFSFVSWLDLFYKDMEKGYDVYIGIWDLMKLDRRFTPMTRCAILKRFKLEYR